ncbi:hypothetical protein LCGC14_1792290 [marine sediment metagenome]|uniref:Lipoprotein n=1 Tax=marine sediment metagenome TaxID=412755 RepID=A0A0F9GS59_9ZZZZ|nr:hypothetical protein [Candidatus Scalindua sp.]
MKYFMLATMLVFLGGCSTARPYVTSISSDGRGGLIIQKGYTEYNYLLGVIGNKEAGESTIQVISEK